MKTRNQSKQEQEISKHKKANEVIQRLRLEAKILRMKQAKS